MNALFECTWIEVFLVVILLNVCSKLNFKLLANHRLDTNIYLLMLRWNRERSGWLVCSSEIFDVWDHPHIFAPSYIHLNQQKIPTHSNNWWSVHSWFDQKVWLCCTLEKVILLFWREISTSSTCGQYGGSRDREGWDGKFCAYCLNLLLLRRPLAHIQSWVRP